MIDLPGYRNQRNGAADLLKGFAVILMIQVHIMEQFATPDLYGSTIGRVSLFLGGPFCAPVFLAVMGYFLASGENRFSSFARRGVLLFTGGILLNTARSAHLLGIISTGKIHLDPLFYILGADILTLAGLSVILLGLLRLLFRQSIWIYLIATVTVAFVSPYLGQHPATGKATGFVTAFLWGDQSWSYFPVFPWFSYVLAGFTFSLSIKQFPGLAEYDLSRKFLWYLPAVIIVLASLPYVYSMTHHLDGKNGYYHHGIQLFGWMVLFMLLYFMLIRQLDMTNRESTFLMVIKWIGQKVTLIYVIQWIIIGNIAPWLYKSQDLIMVGGWLVVVLVSTFLIAFLTEKGRVAHRKARLQNP